MDDKVLSGLTPLMQQYFQLRKQYDDAILLFQVGDFYELFFDDAQRVATFLGIALTKRGTFENKPIPLCGFPVHVLDHYVAKLVKGGFKVALCQQLEQAVAGKMVARGVTQVFTPGTLISETLLESKSASYLFAFFPMKDSWGLLFSELLTSQLHATILPGNADRSLETELYRFLPDEVVLQSHIGMKKFDDFFKQRGFFTSKHTIDFEQEQAIQVQAWCKEQFSASVYDHLQEHPALTHVLGLWHSYVSKNQKDALVHCKDIQFYSPDQFLLLDPATQKNLDIVANGFDGSKKNSLVTCMDYAVTPMGSRMIRRWLLRPLVDKAIIAQRHDAIEFLLSHPMLLSEMKLLLEQFGDLQRIVGRIALYKASIKDYIQLGRIAGLIPGLKLLLEQSVGEIFKTVVVACIDVTKLHVLLSDACNNDVLQPDWIIKQGFDEHLDYLRDCISLTDKKLLELELSEQKRTGISTLKIRQNNVHGFYIEVTKTHTDLVPLDYIRQQTLVGRERYTMPRLQQMQAESMQANITIEQYEKDLFTDLKDQVLQYTTHLRILAESIAIVDALVGFTLVAYQEGYVRPKFNDQRDIIIKQGKHPIIAKQLQSHFIANSTQLTDDQALWIITGPNMGGKSTYLRQVALICILAQAGAFVPAESACLPLLDRIFTRIGAGDNLAEGKSTFLIEMEETAQICLQATDRSLVILDEVGRGTSTFDGLALAQAVIEYLYTHVQARCLFATHYHELTYLQDHYDGIVNYHADSKKTEQGILFLHKIIKGIARQSFGLDVAKLAKLPTQVLLRAEQLVREFEKKENPSQQIILPLTQSFNHDILDGLWKEKYEHIAQELEQQKNIIAQMKSIDFDALSPRQAFDILWDLQKKLDR